MFIHDHFQNFKRYNIPKAQLVIADIPYVIGSNAYGFEIKKDLYQKGQKWIERNRTSRKDILECGFPKTIVNEGYPCLFS